MKLLPQAWSVDEAVPRLARVIGIVVGLLYIPVGLVLSPWDLQSVAVVIGTGIVLALIIRFVLIMLVGWYLDRRQR